MLKNTIKILFVYILSLSSTAYAYDVTTFITVDSKYEQAVKTSSVAIYKQIGLEAKVNQAQSAIQDKGNNWIKLNNLAPIASAIGTAVPIILTKKIQVNTKNFVITGTIDKKEVDWKFSF